MKFMSAKPAMATRKPTEGSRRQNQSAIVEKSPLGLKHLNLFCMSLCVGAFACNTAIAGTFFTDNFEDNDVRDGAPIAWRDGTRNRPSSVRTSDGDLLLVSESRSIGGINVDSAEPIFGDAIFRTQFSFTESRDGGDFVGIFSRGTDVDCVAPCGNYWGGVRADGLVASGIHNAINGTSDVKGWKSLNLDALNRDVVLELVVEGSRVNMTAWQAGGTKPSRPQITFSDSRFAAGDVGVFVQASGSATAAFRYFEASPLLAGDFSGNGVLDVADLDSIVGEIGVRTNNGVFDLNGDADVNQADVTQWLSDAAVHNGFNEAYLAGDSNLDGSVNATDLNNLGLNWRQNVALWSGGDFMADGSVNAADLNELALNWQHSIPMALTASAPVPEPSALLLTVVGLALAWRRPRRS